MARLKVYNGTDHRRVAGMGPAVRQVEALVAATSWAAAHRALAAAGISGWSLYALRNYWAEGGEIPEALDRPGVPFYRPMDAPRAPWVPWDQDYPADALPAHMRFPELED